MPGPVVGRAEVDVHADLSPFRRELTAAAARAGRDYGDTLASSIDSRLRRTTRIFDKFWGSTLRGSRNDFLNFVGVVSSGIERLVGNVIGRGLGLVAGAFDRLGTAIARFPDLLKFADGFRRVAENIRGLGAGGIDGLIVQILALVAAFNIGVNAIGFLAGGISTLTAGVTALAVGIGGALFGGMVALVPVVGSLVVGIATLTVAFSEMTDAQQAVFAPLGDLFRELRSGVQETLFASLGGQVGDLVTALRPLGSVLNAVAAEFGDWVAEVIAQIGPGGPLAETLASLGTSIPQTFGRLLDVLTNLTGGLLGLFDAATPAADRLLEAINGVLARFNEWVNSVQGQEGINEFLQQAIDLLGTLFGIAGEVGTALANLWTAGGADAAQILLDNIREIVANFNTWVSDEGGRDALLRWFQDGVVAVQALGGVMSSLITLFDALDTTFTRLGFAFFLGFLEGAILLLADLATRVQENTIAVGMFVNTISGQISGVLGVLGSFRAQMEAVGESGRNLRAAIVGVFTQIGTAIGDFASRAIRFLGSLRSPMELLAANGRQLRGTLIGVFTQIGSRISNFVADVGRFLGSLRNPMELVAQNGRELRADLLGVFSQIGSGISRFVNDARRFLGGLRSPMELAAASGRQLRATLATVFADIAAAVARGIDRAVNALREFGGRVNDALGGLPGRLIALGQNMMQGLLSGIVDGGNRVLSYLRDLAAQAAAAFANVLDINSPSKVFEEFGRNITEGLVRGLDAGISDILGATNSIADAAAFPAMNAPVSSMASQAASGGSGSAPSRSTTDVGGITIVTPYANPRLVALEVMDELAARGK